MDTMDAPAFPVYKAGTTGEDRPINATGSYNLNQIAIDYSDSHVPAAKNQDDFEAVLRTVTNQLEDPHRANLPMEEIKESTSESFYSNADETPSQSPPQTPSGSKSQNMKRRCIQEWGEDYWNDIYSFYRVATDRGMEAPEIKRQAVQKFGPQANNQNFMIAQILYLESMDS